MKVTAFEGNKGDSILLQSVEGKNILIDGGLVDPYFDRIFSYRFNIAPTLGAMRESSEELDLVCVSHIDQDHIGGILSMLDDEFAWRVYEYQKTQGLEPVEPKSPRPANIKSIWHNSFHEQLNMNAVDIADALAATAPALLVSGDGTHSHGTEFFSRLTSSMSEAAKVSRRLGEKQLGIPLNQEFDGRLVMRGSQIPKVEIGDLTISVLGPTKKRLTDLRKKWNKWLKSQKGNKAIRNIAKKASDEQDLLANGDLKSFLLENELGPAVGNRDSVTEENVASIILMVEEGGKRMLFTGDARDDDIIDDLIATGFANNDGHIHLDVLKLQHHGSENNFSIDFGKLVTADHYLICGNGKHDNPDLRVVKRLLGSRLGSPAHRSTNLETDDKFHLWFTSDGSTYKANQQHMDKVISIVEEASESNPGRLEYHFSSREKLSFDL